MVENVLKRRCVVLGAVGIVVALVLLLSFRCGGEETLTILYWQAPSTPNPYLSGGYKDRDAGAITLEPLGQVRSRRRPCPGPRQRYPHPGKRRHLPAT